MRVAYLLVKFGVGTQNVVERVLARVVSDLARGFKAFLFEDARCSFQVKNYLSLDCTASIRVFDTFTAAVRILIMFLRSGDLPFQQKFVVSFDSLFQL